MEQQPESVETPLSEAEPQPAAIPAQPLSAEDADLHERAAQVHAAVETWSGRLVDAVRGGRSATSAARMATARTAAELRRLATPSVHPGQPSADGNEGLSSLVADYLRQATNAVSNAAHEIERNRYSLSALERQLKKLDELYKRIHPEPEAEMPDAAGEAPLGAS
ncbi:MAG TPA: hypothetical protein VND24_05850 [Steroidobacteraceae bacterium]|nr:hypothetical protein [Steroidobacteraceae bacterium]